MARLPFGIERVEAVAEIGEELFALDIARGGGEAHVVGLERVGDHELVAVAEFQPIGQVVVVGVGDPIETGGFGGEADGVHGAAPGVPALRGGTRDLFVEAEGFGDLGAFDLFWHVAVIDPFQAVGGDLPPGRLHRGDLFRVAGQRGGDTVNGDRQAPFGEEAVEPPESRARAVIVEGFHVPVAHARPGLGTGDVGEEGFGLRVAVQEIVLAPFFVVEDEGDGDLRPPRPAGIGRVGAVAPEIARVAVHGDDPGFGSAGASLGGKGGGVYQKMPERPIRVRSCRVTVPDRVRMGGQGRRIA